MSKELEALERLAMPDEMHIEECKKLGIGPTEDYEVVKQAILELNAINESNSSEAIECLDEMFELSCDGRRPACTLYEVVRQTLLKMQEQEKENIDYGSARERWKIICQMINRMFGFNIEEKWSDDDKVITQALTKAQEEKEENKFLSSTLTKVNQQYTDLMLAYQKQQRMLNILKPYLRLVGNYLQVKMPLVDNDSWVNIKEITDKEELELLKKILGQTQI